MLIISNDGYNTANQDMIVAAVTSNLEQQGISITTDELTQGQLPKPSIIRSDKIYTLNQSIVIKRVGLVIDDILDKVKADIVKLISCETK